MEGLGGRSIPALPPHHRAILENLGLTLQESLEIAAHGVNGSVEVREWISTLVTRS